MAKANGFLQLRRGVFEHIRDGRMSLADFAVYCYIIGQADTRTGVWNGSAGALAGELSVSPRMARKLLERLSRAGYIKRFAVPGKHICYPILVHKFAVTNGEYRGEQLNATASMSPDDLRYVPGEHVGDLRGELEASQKILETREGRKEKKPAASPPADPRYQPFVDSAYRSFEAKHSQKPTWNGKDFKNLTALLRKNQTLTSAELERRWNHYSASTEAFTAKQGDSLAYFCAKFDSFIDGPILGSTGGKTDGKAVSGHQERQKRTLEARDRALSRGSRWTDTDRPVLAAGSE